MGTFVGITLLALALCLTNVHANSIRCFSCDDCIKEKPTIVQCSEENGIDLNAYSLVQPDPILTPPPLVGGNGGVWYPGNPLLTPPPLVGSGGNWVWNPGYPFDPLLTPPPLVGGGDNSVWYPGNPLLTPPPLVGSGGNWVWNPGYPFDPLLTPPPLVGGAGNTVWYPGNPLLTPPPYPYGKEAKQLPAKLQKRFVCVTVRSTGMSSFLSDLWVIRPFNNI
ncbi:pollen-specific leucine-rich repeat extensin-like protein 3 [Anopheles albimanus]|uniref:pollen-specific leucine-rich repeat extensin-like protein 3 n=1 Tax=Anopheles albimanus TaxID=7167 RepID=UPI0016415D73|nr:pollen-specific leucine-rich repeat extensin-like protein 3 [Anopheles albimanus]XP_035772735.1 pollen-specific leucine-rich repeat extensin-like protein 3 [Anopheles albimanus]